MDHCPKCKSDFGFYIKETYTQWNPFNFKKENIAGEFIPNDPDYSRAEYGASYTKKQNKIVICIMCEYRFIFSDT